MPVFSVESVPSIAICSDLLSQLSHSQTYISANCPDDVGIIIQKIIVTNIEKCTGCKLCALACSLAHYRSFSLQNSRLTIRTREATNLNIPYICENCVEQFCASACPVGAICSDEKLGILNVNREKCTGCALCVQACRYKGIKLDTFGLAIKCDLCGGDPECVKCCVFPQAIRYVEANRKTKQMKLQNARIKLQDLRG